MILKNLDKEDGGQDEELDEEDPEEMMRR